VFLFHKTTNRQVYEEAKLVTQQKNPAEELFDVLLYNELDEVTEFTIGCIVYELKSDQRVNKVPFATHSEGVKREPLPELELGAPPSVETKLYTPPLRVGCLPGVFRQVLLERKMVEERVMMLDELKDQVSRIWLVNSLRGWVPIELKI
jgi:para-aminobenzoate synthetase/4-amino-4-deoxychorismate lyase